MVAKTLLIAGTALAAAFAVAGPAAAQQGPDQGRGADDAGILNRLDTNRDGSVDKPEYDATLASAFSAADRNNDGKLSAAELTAAIRALVGRVVIQQRLQPTAPAPGASGNNQRVPDRRDRNDHATPNNQPRFQAPLPPRFDQRRFQFQFQPRFQTPNVLPHFQAPGNQPRFQAPNVLPRQPQPGPQPRGLQPQPPQAAPTPPAPPQGGPQGGPQGNHRTPGFNAIDRNGDGVITPDEFANAFGRRTI